MPLLDKQNIQIKKRAGTEDAYYYLASKVQEKYLGLSFHERANSWKDSALPPTSRSKYLSVGAKKIPLKGDLKKFKNVNLASLIGKRATTQKFSGKSITYVQLSNLLQLSCGRKKADLRKRVYPSAGARYPLEFYVLAFNVEKLEPGLYHFNPQESVLESMRHDDQIFHTKKYWSQAKHFTGAAALIFTAAVFERSRQKYGNRALRYILLEAGTVGQQMNLLGELMGLGFNYDGDGYEANIEELLGIDGVEQGLIMTFVIGKRALAKKV
jgi:SagB-type dehydrogenase family enzyme